MPLPPQSPRCALESILTLLGGSWTLNILWVLRRQGPTRFSELKRSIEGISAKVLTERLRMLEEATLVYREYVATIPPQVTYGLTDRAQELNPIFDQLEGIAQRWYQEEAQYSIS